MRTIRTVVLSATAVLLVSLVAVRHRRVINSAKLDTAIRTALRTGSTKAQVIAFVRERKPVFSDDLGTQLKARISGLADNMIYDKDVVLTFEFDTNGKLLSYSKQETLTFF
jgi:hypothetical protein